MWIRMRKKKSDTWMSRRMTFRMQININMNEIMDERNVKKIVKEW
jgi:hypothetical protein